MVGGSDSVPSDRSRCIGRRISFGSESAGETSPGETVVVAVTRLLTVEDASVLSELLRRNRAFLAPWQPLRPNSFYTLEGQQESVAQALTSHEAGNSLPLVIVDQSVQVVGTITLQSIIRGAFQSCSVDRLTATCARMARPLRSPRVTRVPRYYGPVRPCASHQLLNPSQFHLLGALAVPAGYLPRPEHRGDRFPRSARTPGLRSRRLHAGHHLANQQAPARLVPGQRLDPGFDVVDTLTTLHRTVRFRSP